MDFLKPYRDRTYRDFDGRVAKKIRHLRRIHRSPRLRKLQIDDYDAAEITYISGHRLISETYLALPFDDKDTWGEIYVIFFDGPATAEGHHDLATYRTLLASLHLR